MIGQERLLQEIDTTIKKGFPRFTIICGAKHSGRKLVAAKIAKGLKAVLVVGGIKVDEVRTIIDLAYKQSEPTVYLLADCDKMSPAAQNALLKITEEPPRRAYFIMTLDDIENTLPTLKSRGRVLNIDQYKPRELLEYAGLKEYKFDEAEEKIVSNICIVPGDVDIIVGYNILNFYNFANQVINNIGTVSGSNAFKIAQKLNFKEGDGGYDIDLFLRAIMYICAIEAADKLDWLYVRYIQVTGKYLSQLKITGINKPATIDMWVLDMRKAWG